MLKLNEAAKKKRLVCLGSFESLINPKRIDPLLLVYYLGLFQEGRSRSISYSLQAVLRKSNLLSLNNNTHHLGLP